MRPSKLTTVLAVTVVLAASAVLQPASGGTVAPPPPFNHIYVTITGSKQGMFKNDVGTTGAFEAVKLSYGVTEGLVNIATAAGPATVSGVRNYVPIHFSKFTGFASGELLTSMISNELLSLVQIDFVRDTMSGPELISRIELTNAHVVGIQNTSQMDAAGSAVNPLEDIALIAQTFKFSFLVRSATGTVTTTGEALDPRTHFVQ